MAESEKIEKLRTDFKDDIINTEISDKRRYEMIDNPDGTISLEDMTTYYQIGSMYGAEQINKTNETINALIDKTSKIDNTPDEEKNVAYAEEAGNAETADLAESTKKLQTARKINGVEFDGTKDITIKDDTKISKNEDFVLKNQATLTFEDKVCTINDERITANSLADVYFTTDTITQAERAVVSVETYGGYLKLIAQNAPTGTIKASIKIRVV